MMADELTAAQLVWNRAIDDCSETPGPGDAALSSLLHCHGLVMNGGVFHAVELSGSERLFKARAGYRFFGFENVAELLAHAKDLLDAGQNLGEHEHRVNLTYEGFIPDDSFLFKRFGEHLEANPTAFAPL